VAERKATKRPAQKSASRTTVTGKPSTGFTDEEKGAMRQRVKELKAAAGKEDAEREVLEKIAAMKAPDRVLGERLHALIKATAPALSPRLWYGMPAYYRDGKLICHFQDAQKFKTRYATLGFSDQANLDDGALWPVAYALTKLTAADEANIRALVKQALS
jgi:uncharacterized protein YdhG (YjbR/CyaY superfamily)